MKRVTQRKRERGQGQLLSAPRFGVIVGFRTSSQSSCCLHCILYFLLSCSVRNDDSNPSEIVSYLSIANATPADSGQYTCSFGRTMRTAASVNIVRGKKEMMKASEAHTIQFHIRRSRYYGRQRVRARKPEHESGEERGRSYLHNRITFVL